MMLKAKKDFKYTLKCKTWTNKPIIQKFKHLRGESFFVEDGLAKRLIKKGYAIKF